MFLRIIFCLMMVGTFITASAQDKQSAKILQLLQQQQASWNDGNLEAFMEHYWKHDSLMFIGKNGITYGWNNTLNNYKKGYPNREAMGKLTFTVKHIRRISSKYYQVIGAWHLKRSKDEPGGHYTLLFQKINGRWVIVSDHTS